MRLTHMTFKTFSIKNFISDLPRMLNENFAVIKERMETFFTDDNRIQAKAVKATGPVECNSVSTQTLTVKSKGLFWHNGSEFMGISDLVARIEQLEKRVSELENK